MKLTNIKNLGRYKNPSTGRYVNVKKGKRVGRSTDHYFYLYKGKRQFINDSDFHSKDKWERENNTDKFFKDIMSNITPERQKEMDEMMDAHIKWMDAHPDFNKRYGTDKSYWLEEIKAKGFNPVGITVMICEETIIMETKEEIDKAWEIFKPEGWWYTIDVWEKTRRKYIKDMYDGKEEDAPMVYCLNEKFKEIIR